MYCTKRKMTIWLVLLLLITPIISTSGCGSRHVQLKVLCADSLMVPFEEMAHQFESLHPDVAVLIEGHGSIQVIREVTELHNEADVLAVADHALIPMMMYGNKVPGKTEDYADWYIDFATNRMGIAYTSHSKYAAEIGSDNWYDVLSRPSVKVGISDPRIDSCGYRALMVCQLAELYYQDNSIFENVLGSFSPPITVNDGNGTYTISVPEIVGPDRITVRGYSTQLLGLLESGDIDYTFEYESVARQRGLEFLELPSEINLSSESLADQYRHVTVKLDFRRFAFVIPQFYGEPIVYALTIPANSPHSDEAVQFVEFLLGTDGQRVLSEAYQPMLLPVEVNNPTNMPTKLRVLPG